MQESQDDTISRTDITSAIHESNEIFAKSMQQMSSSISLLNQGMNGSMEAFSRGRGSFQERPLSRLFMSQVSPAQSQSEFSRILSQKKL